MRFIKKKKKQQRKASWLKKKFFLLLFYKLFSATSGHGSRCYIQQAWALFSLF